MDFDEDSYRRVIDGLYDGLYFVDRDRVIRYWNKSAERITGFTAAEVIGKRCSDNILTHVDEKGKSLCRGSCPLKATLDDRASREAEIYLHHKEGHRIPVSVRISPLTDSRGNITGGAELFTDISRVEHLRSRIRELEELALLDSLTRLPNRRMIDESLGIFAEERKRTGLPFGVLFIDIDHFKVFNDTHGHEAGDRVLKFVANTLARNSRPFDLVGRWGGEEFLAIIRNVGPKQLRQLGNRLRVLVEKSYVSLGGRNLRVSVSIGATLMGDNDSIDSLTGRADTLLYESKQRGRNRLTLG